MEKKKILLVLISVIIILLIISVLITFFAAQSYLSSLRIVFGIVYVLFLPGFIITFIFFPESKNFDDKDKKGIDYLERIALSFALSIAIVPLAVFYLNLIHLKINTLNTFLTILGIIIISGIILHWRLRKLKNKF